MQRDWDCVRAILMAIEDKPIPRTIVQPEELRAWAPEVVMHNMHLLGEAGLIEIRERLKNGAPIVCVALQMTWEGHELLDRIRRLDTWNQLRAIARDRAIDLTFDAIKILAAKYVEHLLSRGI